MPYTANKQKILQRISEIPQRMMKRQAISDLNTTTNNVNTTKKYANDKYKEQKHP